MDAKYEIPQDWDFPEKNQPDLKVVQLDLNEQLLTFNLPDINPPHFRQTYPQYQGEYRDYIFADGRARSFRTTQGLYTVIFLTKDGYNQVYAHDNSGKYEGLEIHFQMPGQRMLQEPDHGLGCFWYENGKLTNMMTGKYFHSANNGEPLYTSPCIWLMNAMGKPEDNFWSLWFRSTQPEQTGDHSYIFPDYHGKGKDLVFGWKPTDTEMMCMETIIEGGEIIARKILRAALEMNNPVALRQKLLARPPYPKIQIVRGVEALDIPWLDLSDLVDATLSYEE